MQIKTPGEIEVNQDRLKRLFRAMVDLYSPSGKEHELVEYLSEYLRDAGLTARLREVSDGRCNIEIHEPGTTPEVAFVGHLDTVGAFDIEEYEFSERDGLIYGLGTADMKSGCAAMIEAFTVYQEKLGGIAPSAGLFLVVGEEEAGDGISAVLEEHSFSSALVAEPTDLIPCLIHYGYIEMEIRAFGHRRHASLAGREYNAIFNMLRMLLRLGGLLEADHPEVVLNIRDLHSSESGFAVPDRCDATVDLHVPPTGLASRLLEEVKGLVDNCLLGGAVTGHEIEVPTLSEGYRVSPEAMLPSLIEGIYHRRGLSWAPGAFKSQSDANLMSAAGCKPLVLGPGQLGRAHTRDESVYFAQVAQAAEIYLDILEALDSGCTS